jgi:hypothetical protein
VQYFGAIEPLKRLVEYGVEARYGGGNTIAVNAVTVTA